jgi:hyaluronan synthase
VGLRKEQTAGRRQENLFIVLVIFIITIVGLFYTNYLIRGKFELFLGIYGSIMITYLLGKMALSFFYRPIDVTPPDLKVSVIIPSYNEKPDAVVQTVECILAQDYPIHEIFFIDDGSKDVSGFEAVKKMENQVEQIYRKLAVNKQAPVPKLVVHRLEKNSGKRHAQIWAFERATGDVFVTVDSDGYLYPDCVRELVKPFVDPTVMGVTGHINARNKDESLFTKLLDMRYDNAFRVERAAQSVTGNILVCSGPVSCYRREVVIDNLEDYGSQTFLGERVQYGDDRCLTNYAILKGKTIYQSTARCITDVPSTLRQFLKQQIRWNKSFFRESLIAFKIGLKKPKTLVWVLFELSLWLLFGLIIIVSLFTKAIVFGWVLLVYYFAYLSLSAYARNVYYLLKHPLIFLLAPVYGLIHITLLFPLRFYALLTIKSTGWGTR